MHVVLGLGNPGDKYKNTRHNIGFMVLDYIAKKHGLNVWQKKFQADFLQLSVKGEKILLVKPQTYMNLSGDSLQEVLFWYKKELSALTVIYDDLDLPLGSLRLRNRGSAGGHKGVLSVMECLERMANKNIVNDLVQDFNRIRIGINRQDEGWQVVDWVLSNFKENEKEKINQVIKLAAEATEELWHNAISKVMNQYNKNFK